MRIGMVLYLIPKNIPFRGGLHTNIRPSKARRKLLGLRHIFPSFHFGKTSFMARPNPAVKNVVSNNLRFSGTIF